MFVIEAAIAKAAEQLNISAAEIQQKNLLQTGDEFPYGQIAQSEANECWSKANQLYGIKKMQQDIDDFNRKNKWHKKGMALMPICFGISFTKTHMNQARALVHIYNDGSVGVSTAGVEMGQGLNTKILQVAAATFSIDPGRVKINTTNTYRIANTSPTAASASSDLNGKATEIACLAILQRVKQVAADEWKTDISSVEIKDDWIYIEGKKTEWQWNKLAWAAFEKRVSLSEHAHYAPPGIYFDITKEKGHPFTIDGGENFDMGEAAGHFSYIEDPDGALIEFVQTKKVPIMKKLGWYLDLRKRDTSKPLPDWMLKALKFNRVKE